MSTDTSPDVNGSGVGRARPGSSARWTSPWRRPSSSATWSARECSRRPRPGRPGRSRSSRSLRRIGAGRSSARLGQLPAAPGGCRRRRRLLVLDGQGRRRHGRIPGRPARRPWALGEARLRQAPLHIVHAWMLPLLDALPEPWVLATPVGSHRRRAPRAGRRRGEGVPGGRRRRGEGRRARPRRHRRARRDATGGRLARGRPRRGPARRRLARPRRLPRPPARLGERAVRAPCPLPDRRRPRRRARNALSAAGARPLRLIRTRGRCLPRCSGGRARRGCRHEHS